jgi:hypothetical protein
MAATDARTEAPPAPGRMGRGNRAHAALAQGDDSPGWPDRFLQRCRFPDRALELTGTDGACTRMTFAGAATVEARPCHWYPEFGIAVANRCVVARFAGNTLATHVEWG